MSGPTSFTPKHTQPITLEQAMQLEVDQLIAEISRLENSIKHLQRTQDELLAFLRDSPADDEDGEIRKAVEENEGSISGQNERVDLIKVALRNKVGEDAARHYGLAEAPGPPARTEVSRGTEATRLAQQSVQDVAEGNDEDGMYL